MKVDNFSGCGHICDELFVVDEPVAVFVGLLDHLLDVRLAQLLPELLHHVAQFISINCAISIHIEHFETFAQLLLLIVV